MSNEYAWWQKALDGHFGAITEAKPELGFYRVKPGRNAPWIPAAIWNEDGSTWAMVGKEAANASADFVRDTWLRCAKYPVTEDQYRHAMATGQWPGDAPAEERNPRIGDNRPPEGFDELAMTIESQAKEAEAWLQGRRIASQADADRCETLANAFLGLKKQAEAEHKTEKEPHLKAGRAVDAKYKPLIERAQAMARRLKSAVTDYLLARERERQAAAAQKIAAGETAARTEIKATTSGVSGRKLGLRTVRSAEIEDWDKAIEFFKAHPELRELVQRLADKCAQVGAPVPGVRFKEERKAA